MAAPVTRRRVREGCHCIRGPVNAVACRTPNKAFQTKLYVYCLSVVSVRIRHQPELTGNPPAGVGGIFYGFFHFLVVRPIKWDGFFAGEIWKNIIGFDHALILTFPTR
jgi:hypothetical protein